MLLAGMAARAVRVAVPPSPARHLSSPEVVVTLADDLTPPALDSPAVAALAAAAPAVAAPAAAAPAEAAPAIIANNEDAAQPGLSLITSIAVASREFLQLETCLRPVVINADPVRIDDNRAPTIRVMVNVRHGRLILFVMMKCLVGPSPPELVAY